MLKIRLYLNKKMKLVISSLTLISKLNNIKPKNYEVVFSLKHLYVHGGKIEII